MARTRPNVAGQRGLALVAVLWIVAALTVIVSSISFAVRQEVRAVSGAKQALALEAMGQAALYRVMQELATRPEKPQRLASMGTSYRDVDIQVRVQPLNGLVDINNAPEGLLALLFQHAGGAERPRAAALAAAAVQFRSRMDHRSRPVGFEAPEDLLQVPGVDYTLYARLTGFVTADVRGSGRVSALGAPAEVLGVLAGGDFARGAALAAERDAGRPTLDTTTLAGQFVEASPFTQRYRLEARVPAPDGAWLLVTRTVDFAAARQGVPWRVLHSDHRFEPPPGEASQ
jgi:general secretion pathway protein K